MASVIDPNFIDDIPVPDWLKWALGIDKPSNHASGPSAPYVGAVEEAGKQQYQTYKDVADIYTTIADAYFTYGLTKPTLGLFNEMMKPAFGLDNSDTRGQAAKELGITALLNLAAAAAGRGLGAVGGKIAGAIAARGAEKAAEKVNQELVDQLMTVGVKRTPLFLQEGAMIAPTEQVPVKIMDDTIVARALQEIVNPKSKGLPPVSSFYDFQNTPSKETTEKILQAIEDSIFFSNPRPVPEAINIVRTPIHTIDGLRGPLSYTTKDLEVLRSFPVDEETFFASRLGITPSSGSAKISDIFDAAEIAKMETGLANDAIRSRFVIDAGDRAREEAAQRVLNYPINSTTRAAVLSILAAQKARENVNPSIR